MRGLFFIMVFAAALAGINCSNSTDANLREGETLTGIVTDTLGNPLSDVRVSLVFHFDTLATFKQSKEENNISILKTDDQGGIPSIAPTYPNPFYAISFFEYTLTDTSAITASIYDFNNNIVIADYMSVERLLPGLYQGQLSLNGLPSGGYKLVMNVEETNGSVYKPELNFVMTYSQIDLSIINEFPNAISEEGVFKINYKDIPFGQNYLNTTKYDPDVKGLLQVNYTLTVFLYKYDFGVMQQDVTIDPNFSKAVDFVLKHY
jgi:hypothetical protein